MLCALVALDYTQVNYLNSQLHAMALANSPHEHVFTFLLATQTTP